MRGWMMVAACTLPFAALAQPEATAPADNATAAPAPAAAPAAGQGFGSQTRYWLATQTSGASSATDARPMPGEVASLVYQRYLNSFTHPIPERFEADTFSTKGSGSTP
ncbi:MAG TPA: DUF3613 domain-containing protein [Nevskia sp.]|nr:DUF3613 domain-containing protein [Nevskia sp.]